MTDIYALLGQQELNDNLDILGSPVRGVSLSVKWREWFNRHIPADLADVRGAKKEVMLRAHLGVWTPHTLLDINDGPIPTFPITHQGTAYHYPTVWHPKYIQKAGQFLSNRIFPVLVAGDRLAVSLDMVESVEMHMPDEALLYGFTETQSLADWQNTLDVFASVRDLGIETVLNVSPIIADWTERILPELNAGVDYTGCNILVGDPEQGTGAQGFLSLQHPGQKGNYKQRGLLGAWLGRTPTLEERRENLIGMISKCDSWGVSWLEVGLNDVRDFPDVIAAAQDDFD